MTTHLVLHIDDDILVVNKAKGVLTTPAHGEEGLVNGLDRRHVGREKLHVVHRLDKETSGILVFARNARAARKLSEQFAAHRAEREYVATVRGTLADERGTITEDVLGKKAVTHYEVLRRGDGETTLALRLETGRRNQIRRHLAGMGHPILGDVRFGGPEWWSPGIALDARSLGFVHPGTGKPVRFGHQVQTKPTPATS